MLPAPGQGALAVECRADDADVVAALGELDDADTRACVTAERAVLAALEAGCSAPVGALAEVVEGEDGLELSLRAFVGASTDRSTCAAPSSGRVGEAEAPRRDLAAVLLEDGAELACAGPRNGPARRARPPTARPRPSRGDRTRLRSPPPLTRRPEPTATERAT